MTPPASTCLKARREEFPPVRKPCARGHAVELFFQLVEEAPRVRSDVSVEILSLKSVQNLPNFRFLFDV